MHYFSSNLIVGILGGGQLGKMLLFETQKFDIKTKVLDSNAQAPARWSCNEFVQGDLMDFDTVVAFGESTDVLTFDIENVNVEALEYLEQKGIQVYPSSATLKIIQHKGRQKTFYKNNDIPTADFVHYNNRSEAVQAIQNGQHSYPCVWKSCQFGYDGYGVKMLRNNDDLKDLLDVECIIEKCIPFEKELAVVVARTPQNEVKAYPVVEMEFHPEANQVEYVLCPARIEDAIAQKATEIALKVSKAYQHVGLLAVELFLTTSGEILVNEVAPRPHNSGHYSIEASYTSQFEQHLRSILGLPLGMTESKVAGIMVNLVGEEGYSGDVFYENIEEIMKMEGVTPHIYGKKQTRPFRKMGHVTIVNSSMTRARELAEWVKKTIKVKSN
jgi:5-(carboxyamino)imidazole ribonucleotide synthase